MKHIRLVSLLILAYSSISIAQEPSQQEVRTFVKDIFNDNNLYVQNLSRLDLDSYQEGQSPRATVLMCSDSRVQSTAFNNNPVNDLFFIRNIGNQIKSTEGSIEYGVEHLHTPILLIIGHSACGAIRTALGDFSDASIAIRQELNNLHLKKDQSVDDGVIENVHNQVKFSMEKYKSKIEDQKLVVLGVVYDFRDDFKHGHGKLILIDVNGETDPKKIAQSPYLQGMKDMAIGENRGQKIYPLSDGI